MSSPIYAEMHASRQVGKFAIVVAHALVGWAWCGALIAIGQRLLSLHATLIVHAIGAPLGFVLVSLVYADSSLSTTP